MHKNTLTIGGEGVIISPRLYGTSSVVFSQTPTPIPTNESGNDSGASIRPIPKDSNHGCIIWTGDTDRDGYPRVKRNGRHVYLHRAAINAQPGQVVRHSCDNPSCINPAHLSIGTQADNMRDRQERNRQARGERNGRAKLKAEQVLAIRASNDPNHELGAKYGVSQWTVQDIKGGRIWKHVA